MQSHEIEVKDKLGRTLLVSIEYYDSNSADLKPTLPAADVKTRIEKYYSEKKLAVSKMEAEAKTKMEKEALKNKIR